MKITFRKIFFASTVICLVVFFYLIFILGWDGFTTAKSRSEWRQKIIAVYNDIHVGMSKEQVEKMINEHKWPVDLVYREKDLFFLNSPMELGATNWTCVVELEKGRVIKVKVSTSDGRLKGAPDDKVLH